MPAEKLHYLEMMKDQVAEAIEQDRDFMSIKTDALEIILKWLEARPDHGPSLVSESGLD